MRSSRKGWVGPWETLVVLGLVGDEILPFVTGFVTYHYRNPVIKQPVFHGSLGLFVVAQITNLLPSSNTWHSIGAKTKFMPQIWNMYNCITSFFAYQLLLSPSYFFFQPCSWICFFGYSKWEPGDGKSSQSNSNSPFPALRSVVSSCVVGCAASDTVEVLTAWVFSNATLPGKKQGPNKA